MPAVSFQRDNEGRPVLTCELCGRTGIAAGMIISGEHARCKRRAACRDRVESRQRRTLRRARKRQERAATPRKPLDPSGWQQHAELVTCSKCGKAKPRRQYPYGMGRWCRACLFGPKPRVRIVRGGAPGLGRRNGKRR